MIRRADADGVEILVLLREHLTPILMQLGQGVSGLHSRGAAAIHLGDTN